MDQDWTHNHTQSNHAVGVHGQDIFCKTESCIPQKMHVYKYVQAAGAKEVSPTEIVSIGKAQHTVSNISKNKLVYIINMLQTLEGGRGVRK